MVIGSLKNGIVFFFKRQRSSSDFRVFCVFRGELRCIVPAY